MSTSDLDRAILTILAEGDPLTPVVMTARELAGMLNDRDESAIERRLRALHADGRVEAFHEPYIASRYRISRAGRDAARNDAPTS
jgi:DNA-binding Lrp family transcriptional regulator